jgi:transcription elongation factor GreA
MQNEEIFLTKAGEKKLQTELEDLTTRGRTELAERLRSAVQMGDLSENADYIAAKEAQAFLEGKIQEIQAVLRIATIVEDKATSSYVSVGSEVVVAENGRNDETFMMVGATEADPRNGKISNKSPIGSALMGKKVGETAIAETPGGKIEMKIVKIN